MQPQFQQQQPQPQGGDVAGELLGQILRAVVHIVAKDMQSDFLDKAAAMDDPHELLQVLTQYNNFNEEKIRRREHLQNGPAANAQRPRLANGRPDFQIEAGRAARALFASQLGGK